MKKKLLILLVLTSLIYGASSCSIYKPTSESVLSDAVIDISEKPQGNTNENSEEFIISKKLSIEGKTAQINAKVCNQVPLEISEIILSISSDVIHEMVEEFVGVQCSNPSVVSDADSCSWTVERNEQSLLSLICDTSGSSTGYVSYIDSERNVNGQSLDGHEMASTPYFFTDKTPNLMKDSSQDAAKDIARLFSNFSCFTYVPWNIMAYENKDNLLQSGYYHIQLKPTYNDVPVYGDDMFLFDVYLSTEGVFQFGGVIALEEKQVSKVSSILSVNMALQKFEKDFGKISIGDTLVVDSIQFAYFANSNGDGTYTLSPAWVFECQDIKHIDKTHANVDYYNCLYLIETGELRIDR